ncbi:zinc finger protein OZF-like [Chrysoperla carnea]|uniref:zinc finger protein OZF-like n=1 Tax=Chrysoperla carnea TaxID=189513 RepID=UPI001D09154A|nr:zinc finger protein OZF-like [Chrysoperla carnea]
MAKMIRKHTKLHEDEYQKYSCDLCYEILTKLNQFLIKVKDAQQKIREIFSLSAINNLDIKLEHESQRQQQNNDATTLNSEDQFVDSKVELIAVKTESEGDDCDYYDYANETQESISELSNTLTKTTANVVKVENTSAESIPVARKNQRNLLRIQFKCYKCGEMFRTDELLQNHFKNVHNSKTEYVCLECNALLENLSKFKEHLLYVHCFKNKSSKVFSCKICGRLFKRKEHCMSHQSTHSDDKSFSCQNCGKLFRLKEYLSRHKRKNPECRDELEFKCTHCDKIFKNQYSLDCHMKTHITPDQYKYKCEVCGRKFHAIVHYKCHILVHEKTASVKDYICDQCGKIFKSQPLLNSHLVSHTQGSPYTCEVCSKRYKSTAALKQHQLTHSGKFHECEVCGKKFTRRGQLTIHSSIHTGKLPFKCSYCKKQFRRKSYLQIHLRQHTGERPYSCLECNHSFTNDSNFIKHLRGRHGLQNISIINKHRYPFDDN